MGRPLCFAGVANFEKKLPIRHLKELENGCYGSAAQVVPCGVEGVVRSDTEWLIRAH